MDERSYYDTECILPGVRRAGAETSHAGTVFAIAVSGLLRVVFAKGRVDRTRMAGGPGRCLVLRADGGATRPQASAVVRGAAAVAKSALLGAMPGAEVRPVCLRGPVGAAG